MYKNSLEGIKWTKEQILKQNLTIIFLNPY